MVVSEPMRVRTRRYKEPATEAKALPEAQDASESSRANSRLIDQRPSEREAYVTVDALKNSMSTMTNTIVQQVSEQVEKAMEAARPLPHFDYMPNTRSSPHAGTFP